MGIFEAERARKSKENRMRQGDKIRNAEGDLSYVKG